MLRRFISLFTLFALLLCAGAFAEQPAAYMPGKTTLRLFNDALENNVLLAADMQFQLAGDAEKLGASGRYVDQFNALSSLSGSKLTLAGGQIDDGVRLELAAALNSGHYADAALNITYDGLLAETSLLPGESVSVRWETLLALLGVPQAEANAVLSVRDADMAVVMESVSAQAAPMIQMASTYLTPYAKTIADWALTIPSSTRENVAAQGHYPAAAKEVSYAVCWNDVGTLLAALADQLEGDLVLGMLIDSVLAQQADIPVKSTAELCAGVRQVASQLNNTEYPVYFYAGYDEHNTPLYLSIIWKTPDATALVFDVVHTAASAPVPAQLYIALGTRDTQNNIVDDYSFTLSILQDSVNPLIGSLQLGSKIYVDSDPLFHFDYALSSEPFASAEGQSGYSGNHVFSLGVVDGSTPIHFAMTADTQNAPTAAGGEYYLATGTLNINAGANSFPFVFTQEMTTTPDSAGPVTVYAENASGAEVDLEAAGETFTFYTKAYDPAKTAALACLMLETATNEDVESLMNRLIANAEAIEATLPEGMLYFLSEIF